MGLLKNMPILAGISCSCAVRSAETQLPAHMRPTVGAASDVCGAAAGERGGGIEEGGRLSCAVV